MWNARGNHQDRGRELTVSQLQHSQPPQPPRRQSTSSVHFAEDLVRPASQVRTPDGGGERFCPFQVVVRVKPPISSSSGKREPEISCFVEDDERTLRLSKTPKPGSSRTSRSSAFTDASPAASQHRFSFDLCFDADSSQEEIYQSCVFPLVEAVTEGANNAAVFAYGPSSSGKSFSLEGEPYSDARGLIPRAVETLFEITKADTRDVSYTIRASSILVHHEQLYDLLEHQPRGVLKIMENQTYGTHVPGLTEVQLREPDHIYRVLERSSTLKQSLPLANSTLSASRSSTSQSIAQNQRYAHTITILTLEAATPLNDGTDRVHVDLQKLFFVDMAASELSREGVFRGTRQHDPAARNVSMAFNAIVSVINALGSRKAHIPYRNSKLTHLIQDGVSVNSLCLFLGTVSGAERKFQSTLAAAKYMARLKQACGALSVVVPVVGVAGGERGRESGRESGGGREGEGETSLSALPRTLEDTDTVHRYTAEMSGETYAQTHRGDFMAAAVPKKAQQVQSSSFRGEKERERQREREREPESSDDGSGEECGVIRPRQCTPVTDANGLPISPISTDLSAPHQSSSNTLAPVPQTHQNTPKNVQQNVSQTVGKRNETGRVVKSVAVKAESGDRWTISPQSVEDMRRGLQAESREPIFRVLCDAEGEGESVEEEASKLCGYYRERQAAIEACLHSAGTAYSTNLYSSVENVPVEWQTLMCCAAYLDVQERHSLSPSLSLSPPDGSAEVVADLRRQLQAFERQLEEAKAGQKARRERSASLKVAKEKCAETSIHSDEYVQSLEQQVADLEAECDRLQNVRSNASSSGDDETNAPMYSEEYVQHLQSEVQRLERDLHASRHSSRSSTPVAGVTDPVDAEELYSRIVESVEGRWKRRVEELEKQVQTYREKRKTSSVSLSLQPSASEEKGRSNVEAERWKAEAERLQKELQTTKEKLVARKQMQAMEKQRTNSLILNESIERQIRDEDNMDLQRQTVELEKDVVRLQGNLKRCEEEREELITKLESVETDFRKKISSLESESALYKNKLEAVEKDLDSAKTTVETQQAESRLAVELRSDQSQEIERLRKRLLEVTAQSAKSAKECEGLGEELRGERERGMKQVAACRRELEVAKSEAMEDKLKLETLQADFTAMTQKKDSLSSKLQTSSKELEEMNGITEALRKQLKDRDREIDQGEETIAQLNATIAELKGQCGHFSTLETELEMLANILEDTKRQCSACVEGSRAISKVNQQLAQLSLLASNGPPHTSGGGKTVSYALNDDDAGDLHSDHGGESDLHTRSDGDSVAAVFGVTDFSYEIPEGVKLLNDPLREAAAIRHVLQNTLGTAQRSLAANLERQVHATRTLLDQVMAKGNSTDVEILRLSEQVRNQSDTIQALERQLNESRKTLTESAAVAEQKTQKMDTMTLTLRDLHTTKDRMEKSLRVEQQTTAELRRECEMGKLETVNLQNEIHTLSDMREQLLAEIADLKAQLNDRDDSMRRIESQAQTIKLDRQRLERQNDELSQKLASLQSEHLRVEDELEMTKHNHHQLRLQYETETGRFQELDRTRQEAVARNKDLQSRLETMEESLRATETRVKESVDDHEVLKTQYEAVARRNDELQQVRQQLLLDVADLKLQLHKATETGDEFRREVHVLESKLKSSQTTLEQVHDALRLQQEENEELKAEMQDLQMQVHGIKDQLRTCSEEKDLLMLKLESADKMQKVADGQIEELRASNRHLDGQVRAKTEQLLELDTRFEELQREVLRMTEQRDALEQQFHLQEKEAQSKALEIQKLEVRVKETAEERHQLECDLERLRSELREQQTRMSEMTSQIDDMSSRLEATVTSYEAKLHKAQLTTKKLLAEKETAEDDLEEAKNDLEMARGERDKFHNELLAAKSDLSAVLSEKEQVRNDLITLQSSYVQVDAERAQLNTVVMSKERELVQLSQELRKVREDLDSTEAKLEDFHSLQRQWQRAKSHLEAELQRAADIRDRETERRTVLEEELHTMRSQSEKTNRDLKHIIKSFQM